MVVLFIRMYLIFYQIIFNDFEEQAFLGLSFVLIPGGLRKNNSEKP